MVSTRRSHAVEQPPSPRVPDGLEPLSEGLERSEAETTGVVEPVAVAVVALPVSEGASDVEDDSDDAPDVEVTEDAQAREKQRLAEISAVDTGMKKRRRAKAAERDALAKAVKARKAEREKEKVERERAAEARVIPQHILDRAAGGMEVERAKRAKETVRKGLKLQEGTRTVRVVQKEVDGLTVVKGSEGVKKVQGNVASENALGFLKRCMFQGKTRVASVKKTGPAKASRAISKSKNMRVTKRS